MKYTVKNYNLQDVAETNSFREAFQIADDGTCSNYIYREDGFRCTVSEAAEIVSFVNGLLLGSDEGRCKIGYPEAMTNLIQMSADGIEQPRYMTSEVFADCWNEGIDEMKPTAAQKEYLLKTRQDGILQVSIKTGKQIADIYDFDQEVGIYDSIEVWDIEKDPVRINLYDLVEPILEQKRWMEKEYNDYCDSLRFDF